MRKQLILLAIAGLTALSCGRDEERVARDQQQYETVQEGSAAGVSATLTDGAAMPPLTGTNADTTSAFALDPNAVASTPGGAGTIAGTLPPPMTSGSSGAGWGSPAPMSAGTYRPSAPRRAVTPSPSSQPTFTPAPAPAREAEAAPQPSQPADAEQQPAPAPAPSETTASTDTQPPPAEATPEPPPEEPKKAPEQTTTTPPSSDTTGTSPQ